MGDIVEISTGPKHHHTFYKISSSAINFQVKAPSDAAIGLAKKPEGQCTFWVLIGCENKCWIKRANGANSVKVETPNILSANKYRQFWLAWESGSIRLGRHGDPNAIVTYAAAEVHKLNYITFCTIDDRISVFWKLELPPLLNNSPSLKPITSGKLNWVSADTQLPDNALIGGYEKENLYIIRAVHRQSLTPGKFVPSEGVGYIPWGGQAVEKNTLEILCGYDCTWVSSSEDKIPAGAVEAGYTENLVKEKLYVGRVHSNGYVIPGKVQPSHKVCYIPLDGREVASKKFDILVEPHSSPHCVNKVLISPINVDVDYEDDDDQINDDNSEYEGDE